MRPTAADVLRLRINALLHASGRTRKELAAYMGHTPAWATDLLNGRQGVILADLDRLARFFGLSVPQLFEIDGVRFRERRRGDRRSGPRDRRKGERRKAP